MTPVTSYKKLNISEFTDTTFIKLYSISVDAVVFTTLLLTPFYYYVILRKSLTSMKFYQKFLLIYTTYTLLIILSYAIFKQGFIAPLSTTFSLSRISTNLPKELQIICYVISHTAGGISTDFLLIALFQRYFYVSKTFYNHKKVWQYFCYGFIILTCVVANVWYQIAEIHCFLSENELKSFFVERIENASEFLSTRNNFVIVYGCTRNSSSPLGIFVTFSWLSRPFLLFGIAFKNIQFSKRFSFHMGPNTSKMHKMLLKAVLTQICCCIICSRLPMIYYLIVSAINIPSLLKYDPYIDSFAVCILPLLDMSVTVYFISPYRKFILNVFLRRKNGREKKSSILAMKLFSLTPAFRVSDTSTLSKSQEGRRE